MCPISIVLTAPIESGEKLLKRASIGRLACSLDDQLYILPVTFSYEPYCICILSTLGKKIQWMRKNPKVCLQADEIGNPSNWLCVMMTGTYFELRRPQLADQREHALEKLAQYSKWWRNPLAERGGQASDPSIVPVYFRIDIESMSGLRAVPEAE